MRNFIVPNRLNSGSIVRSFVCCSLARSVITAFVSGRLALDTHTTFFQTCEQLAGINYGDFSREGHDARLGKNYT